MTGSQGQMHMPVLTLMSPAPGRVRMVILGAAYLSGVGQGVAGDPLGGGPAANGGPEEGQEAPQQQGACVGVQAQVQVQAGQAELGQRDGQLQQRHQVQQRWIVHLRPRQSWIAGLCPWRQRSVVCIFQPVTSWACAGNPVADVHVVQWAWPGWLCTAPFLGHRHSFHCSQGRAWAGQLPCMVACCPKPALARPAAVPVAQEWGMCQVRYPFCPLRHW